MCGYHYAILLSNTIYIVCGVGVRVKVHVWYVNVCVCVCGVLCSVISSKHK
jgi:hypothetical protein